MFVVVSGEGGVGKVKIGGEEEEDEDIVWFIEI